VSKKCFRHAEQVFKTRGRQPSVKKVLKTYDFNGAGHPSWVSRPHPSFPFSGILGFIDSLQVYYTAEQKKEKCRFAAAGDRSIAVFLPVFSTALVDVNKKGEKSDLIIGKMCVKEKVSRKNVVHRLDIFSVWV
jgi:hypothetical protein